MTMVFGIPPMIIDRYAVDILSHPNGNGQFPWPIGRSGQYADRVSERCLAFTEEGYRDDRAAVDRGGKIGGGKMEDFINGFIFIG